MIDLNQQEWLRTLQDDTIRRGGGHNRSRTYIGQSHWNDKATL